MSSSAFVMQPDGVEVDADAVVFLGPDEVGPGSPAWISGWPERPVRVWFSGGDFLVENVDPELRSLIQRAILAFRIGTEGGVVLHASASEVDGWAWLFVGHSGAGKSTIVANAQLPIIADDTVLLRPSEAGLVEVRGTEHGRRCTKADATWREVAGVCFLEQSEDVRATRLGARPAFERLLAGVFVLHSASEPPRPLLDPRAISTLMLLVQSRPCYELSVPLGYRFDANDLPK